MKTYYIRLIGSVKDPVWGEEPFPGIRTPLIRVTRNRLRKAVFEWAGNAQSKVNLPYLKEIYPLVVQVNEPWE